MAKVKQQFFCSQEKKTYFAGDQYTGTRKDLSHVVEYEDKDGSPKKKETKKTRKKNR